VSKIEQKREILEIIKRTLIGHKLIFVANVVSSDTRVIQMSLKYISHGEIETAIMGTCLVMS